MTTSLLTIPAAEGLAFEPEAHVYTLDGVSLPSVTQILRESNLISFEDWTDREAQLQRDLGVSHGHLMPPELLEAARARGQRVHKACHYLSEQDLDWSTVEDQDRGYVEGAAAFLADSRFELLRDGQDRPIGRELRVCSYRYRYAGTMDLFGRWNGKFALVDYKTGDPEDVAADLQLAAYENALREQPWIVELLGLKPTDAIMRCSIRLSRKGTYSPSPYSGPEHARDFSYFLAALSLWNYRQNKKGS
jgi:hypothetical protein